MQGDMIYVAGGTVHTLGPGSVVVETQQQSDTTYRFMITDVRASCI